MKEVQLTPDTAIEVKANKDQEKQNQYVGSLTPKPGQKLFAWKFGEVFETIHEVDLKDEKNYHFFNGENNTVRKSLIVQPDHLYACAINKKNAARKILAQFGFKFNTSKNNYVIDMPVEKLPDEFLEIGKPEGPVEKPIDTEATIINLTPKTTENE